MKNLHILWYLMFIWFGLEVVGMCLEIWQNRNMGIIVEYCNPLKPIFWMLVMDYFETTVKKKFSKRRPKSK